MGNCQQKDEAVREEHLNEVKSVKQLEPSPEPPQDLFRETFPDFKSEINLRETGLLSKSIYIGRYYPLIQSQETQSHDKAVESHYQIHGEMNQYLIEYTDGSKYEGEVERITHKPHGYGVFNHSNGDLYSGRFYMGEAHGKGIYRHRNGIVYEGNFIADRKNGFGEENYGNGQIYKGYFKDGVKHGRGRYDWEDTAYYDGDIVKNKKHGLGILFIRDQEIYTGGWHDDFRHGKAKIEYANGDLFEGSFSNNLKEGHGKMRTFEYTFDGWYSNDVKHGKGTETDNKTLVQRVVDYENGVRVD